MKNYLFLGSSLVLFSPIVAFAAPRTFAELVNEIVYVIDIIVPILVSLAVLYFLYNILGSFGIFSGEADAVSKEKFKGAAMWGIATLFVIVSIWGILRALQSTIASSGSLRGGGDAVYCEEFDSPDCI